jgi:hypothetical protein
MPRQRKLLSLEDDVIALLSARENASEYVAQLVRAAESGPLQVALSADELSDLRGAADDASLELPEWARIVLLYTAGRPIAEHLDRASEVGSKLFGAALGEALAKPKRKAAR